MQNANDPFDIPIFLRISQEDRKAAWETYRAARPLPRETKPAYRPLTDIPGAKHDPEQS